MDNKIIIRINSILDHIDEVIEDLKPLTFEEFEKSSLYMRAISFSIALIGEQMINLQTKIGNEYPNLPWKRVRGMRNFIVHDYDSVDPIEVYKAAKEDLPELKEALLKIKAEIK